MNILERIHRAGFIYNDLKLDNLLLDADVDIQSLLMTDKDFFETVNVNIIDYGFVTRYVDDGFKKHVSKKEVDVFRGNILFSSLHQLKFKTTSRRDDIISLFYLLVYLLHDGRMPGFKYHPKQDVEELFQAALQARENQKSKDVCFGASKDLIDFKREVFSYRFKDEPDYNGLRNILKELKYE